MHDLDHQIDLNGEGWTLRTTSPHAPDSIRGRDIPARVPGCVHTDLIRANLIPDPLVGDNEKHVQWIGEADWEYRRRLVLSDAHVIAPSLELVCEGLDTIAELHLNGAPIGFAANMHHSHRFDLKPAARLGDNELSITFRSPLNHIRSEAERLGPRPINGDWDPYVFIRKSASNFGWDWAPKLATCGIWQPIRIEPHAGVRIKAVRPLIRWVAEAAWTLECAVDLDWSNAAELTDVEVAAELTGDERPIAATTRVRRGESTAIISLSVDAPRLWWPRGWGEQALYSLNVRLHAQSQMLGSRDVCIGFRKVVLVESPDKQGASFGFAINGRLVFCQGANWIPEGPYPGQASPEVIRARVQQAAGANMNMLRVWGGGYYESNDFYQACDELGIMVWQDFMFACAMYPEEPPYPALIEAEARHQVARLSSHPSVVLWCGGNECTWAHESWGNAPGERPWKERLGEKTWGRSYYFDLLPDIVKELDPTRPYWANSPWPGQEGLGGNHTDRGDRHTWDLRLTDYTTIVPRFISEFGHQSPSNYSTLLTALSPDDLLLRSPLLEFHQRATGGTAQHIDRSMLEHFRAPRDFDEWHYLAQLLQARAVTIGMEWARANYPRCLGALVWQLNDCWPGMGWSMIDSDGRAKPAAGAFQTAAAPRRLIIQPRKGDPARPLDLYACNDTDTPWRGVATLRRVRFDGEPLATATRPLNLEPRSVQRIMGIRVAVGNPDDPARECVVGEAMTEGVGGAAEPAERTIHFYLKDRELHYPRPQLELDRSALGRLSLRFTARTLMRDVVLNADRLQDCTAGGGTRFRGPVTLLPGDVFGEQAELPGEVPLQAGAIEDAIALTRPPVLWCANWFGAVEFAQP